VHARWLLILALAVPTACDKNTESPQKAAESSEASAKDGKAAAEAPLPDRDSALAHRLVEQEQGVLLDVRTTEEFEGGHIDGATNISHDELSSRLEEVEKLTGGDKSRPIVVYCRSGGRAGQAKKVLTEAGYQRVTNLGGLSDW
jgi:phage shock protein E